MVAQQETHQGVTTGDSKQKMPQKERERKRERILKYHTELDVTTWRVCALNKTITVSFS